MNANVALVRRLFDEAFNARNVEVCDEIIAADYIEHAIAPFASDAPGAVDGPQHMRAVIAWLVSQYPDLTMRVEHLVADGDHIAVRVWSGGTNLGPLNGVIPATGKQFAAHQSHWYRVEHDKLVEHWADRDDLRAMLQLGVLQRPGPPQP